MKQNFLLALLCTLAIAVSTSSVHAETITNTDVQFTAVGTIILNEYIYNDGSTHTMTTVNPGTWALIGSYNPATPGRVSISNGGVLSLIANDVGNGIQLMGDVTHSQTGRYCLQFNDGTVNVTNGMMLELVEYVSVYSGELNVLDGKVSLLYGGPDQFRLDGTGSLVTTLGAAGELVVPAVMTSAADFSTFYGSHVSVQAAPGLSLHFDGTSITAVPEPGTMALLCGGLFGLLAYAWRKRR